MQEKEFDHKLLADIFVYVIDIGFCDYSKYIDSNNRTTSEIANLTKKDIVQLAKTLLDKDEFNSHPEFKTKKPDLFSKLDDATNEAKASLEAKREILHQICLNVIEEFPTLQAVKIESVEYGIIKVTHSDKQVENSTYIAINDEEQLKQNVQEFLDKIKTKKEKSK